MNPPSINHLYLTQSYSDALKGWGWLLKSRHTSVCASGFPRFIHVHRGFFVFRSEAQNHSGLPFIVSCSKQAFLSLVVAASVYGRRHRSNSQRLHSSPVIHLLLSNYRRTLVPRLPDEPSGTIRSAPGSSTRSKTDSGESNNYSPAGRLSPILRE